MKYEKLGRVSSAAVLKRTRKDWDRWIEILDNAGAVNWTHQEIVAFLKRKYKLEMMWQQWVTYGYELAKGKRIEGQSLKGDYSALATRTIPVPAAKLWKFLTSEEGQAVWLKPLSPVPFKAGQEYEAEGGVYGKIRTLKAPVRARISWTETEWAKPTVLNLYVSARSPKKCVLVFSHNGIKDTRIKAHLRDRWKAAADEIALLFTK